MLYTHDLRIGNYIHYDNELETREVVAVDVHAFYYIGKYPESYYGIPVTEEWLIKLSFKKEPGGDYILELRDQFSSKYTITIDKSKTIYINDKFHVETELPGSYKYVHQIQNLLTALQPLDYE